MEVIKGDEYVFLGLNSLPSETVQEIVRNDSGQVPDKFIRDEEEKPKGTLLLSHLAPLAPVIDFSLLSKLDSDELNKLDMACKQWGFFQIINHGVEEDLLQKTKNVVANFFELPLKDKHECLMHSIEKHENEQIGEPKDQKLDWVDILYLTILPLLQSNLKTWPNTPPHFRDTMEEYSGKINKIAMDLLANLSILMGVDKATLEELHGNLQQTMNINHYPPCSRPDEVLGLSPHSDSNSITILLQDDDVTGLHVRHGGGWVPINPIAGALLVNVGDCIEIWSNGKYKSIEHRAVANNKKARTSIVTFIEPAMDAFVEPLATMVEDQVSGLYKKVNYGDYMMYYMARKLEGKKHTEVTKVGNE